MYEDGIRHAYTVAVDDGHERAARQAANAIKQVAACRACNEYDGDARCGVRLTPPPFAVVVATTLRVETHRLLSAEFADYARGRVPVVSAQACGQKWSRAGVAACEANMDVQLGAMGWPLMVAVDDLGWWHPTAPAVDLYGYAGVCRDRWLFALGGWDDRGHWKAGAARLKQLLAADREDWHNWCRRSCVVCRRGNVMYDQAAVPWCRDHWTRRHPGWSDVAVGATATATQGVLDADAR